MALSLKERVERVVWGEEKDAFGPVSALVIQEMKGRIYPGVIWDLQNWARSKTEEHRKAQSKIENIILAVRSNVKDDQDQCLSLQKLSEHHCQIANRYNKVVIACQD
jgi:hypothetical protein